MLGNFYIEADVDGRSSLATAHTRAKDGGMLVKIFQRKDNTSYLSLKIVCRALDDGKLITTVYNEKGEKISECTTDR